MKYNPNKHHRRSIRLKGYDYSQSGLYFITICVKNNACLFGEIVNGVLLLNDAGKMVETEWTKLPDRFKNIELHEFIVMPNHFHAILEIVGATLMDAQNADEPVKKTVGDMVGAFQSIVTVEYIRGVKNNDWQPFDRKLWHRNYWEHIIRNEQSYQTISEYIINNPLKWDEDKFNPSN